MSGMMNLNGAGGGAISMADSPSIDAFGRARVSEPETIFDSKQIFDNAPLFWDDQEVSGSGTTSVHSVTTASSVMAVSATTAGRRIRQTFQRFNYQPGKSQLLFLTGTLGAGGGAGITRCMGCYDDDNGILVQDDEGLVKVVIRSSATGSAVDNKVAQSSWNLDKMDGNGSSGVTLDVAQSQIVIIDYEWLGVGRVRIGFVVDGIPIYCHQFVHSNISAGVYMSTPNLPIRYEIENDGTGAASELEHICAAVMSEGGKTDIGILRYRSTGGTHLDANTADSVYSLIGLRLKSTHLGATVRLATLSVICETNDDFEWAIYLNPTIAGTPSWSNEPNSAIQTFLGDTTTTITSGSGSLWGGGFAKQNFSVLVPIISARTIGSAIDGTPDEMVLAVRPLTANADIQGGATWRELS